MAQYVDESNEPLDTVLGEHWDVKLMDEKHSGALAGIFTARMDGRKTKE